MEPVDGAGGTHTTGADPGSAKRRIAVVGEAGAVGLTKAALTGPESSDEADFFHRRIRDRLDVILDRLKEALARGR